MNGVWLVIACMTLVTAAPRVVPLLLLSGRKMPETVIRWLSLIAPAILSALLLPELILERGDPSSPALSFQNPYLLAAIPAFIVASRTKNLFATVATGMIALALIRLL